MTSSPPGVKREEVERVMVQYEESIKIYNDKIAALQKSAAEKQEAEKDQSEE